MSDQLENALKILSACGAVVGFLLTVRKAREDSLRRSEVMEWANQAIATLETLVVVCIFRRDQKYPDVVQKKCVEIIFDSAILVERGRLFFKNKVADDHGKDKQAAYRGYRPAILDPLVAAHQIAVALGQTDPVDCEQLKSIAETNLRAFVSRIQHEVGRQRTASKMTREEGQAVHIQPLLGNTPTHTATKKAAS